MDRTACPKCGKPVMSWRRFMRKASLFKSYQCASCGAELRRGPGALLLVIWTWLWLLVGRVEHDFFQFSPGIEDALTLLWVICYLVVGNYLSWRYISWEVVEIEKERAIVT